MRLNLTDVTKKFLILNIVFFVIVFVGRRTGFIQEILFLPTYYIGSPFFRPFQLISHMFLHFDFFHLLFNMIGLALLGPPIETFFGKKKFFIFYMLCGFGSFFFIQLFDYFTLQIALSELPNPEQTLFEIKQLILDGMQYNDNAPETNRNIEFVLRKTGVGASGAIFGLFGAFALRFPNTELIVFPIFIPLKAKILLLIAIVVSVVLGFAQIEDDNIAHFAHLGGLVIGILLTKLWKEPMH